MLRRFIRVIPAAHCLAIGFVLLLEPSLLVAQGAASSDGSDGTQAIRDLTVVQLLPLEVAPQLAADLSGMIFAHLMAYENIDVRIRDLKAPPTLECLKSGACVRQLGEALQAEQLLVGVIQGREGHTKVMLLLFDVRLGKPTSRVSIDLTGDSSRFGRMLRPIVDEVATTAGGRRRSSNPKGSTPGVVPAPAEGQAGVGAEAKANTGTNDSADVAASGRTSVARGDGTGEDEAENEPLSLQELLELTPRAPRPSSVAPSPPEPDSSAVPYAASSGHTSSEMDTGMTARTGEERAELERQRARALKRTARRESWVRERQRREMERAKLARMKQAELKAQAKHEQELLEAKVRELESARRRKEAEARRRENIRREANGLSPLPEPAWTGSDSDSTVLGNSPSGTATGEDASSVGSSATNVRANPRAGGMAAHGGRSNAPAIFLENEGQWQVGAFGGVAYLMEFGLLGAGLEVAYQSLPWLWLEGAVESLHGVNPDNRLWFYLVSGRFGALVRRESGPIHPFVGLDGVGVSIGKSEMAWGMMARAGVDIMVSRGIGIRLETSGGAIHSDALTNELYQYPESTYGIFRLGVGLRYHF